MARIQNWQQAKIPNLNIVFEYWSRRLKTFSASTLLAGCEKGVQCVKKSDSNKHNNAMQHDSLSKLRVASAKFQVSK